MRKLLPGLWLSVGSVLLSSSVSAAEVMAYPASVPVGISLEWYQYELDLAVKNIQASVPGVSDETLNSLSSQFDTTNNVKLLNLRLDYQVTPYLNLYGSVGKITDKTEVDFSAISPFISRMEVNNEGVAYTLGARLSRKYGQWLTAFNFAHSLLDLENNDELVTVSSAVPSIGRQTAYGVFSGSLLYQAVEASYSGAMTVPFMGEVPVTVNTENKDDIQIMVGWQKALSKNWFINTDLGLNGKEQFHMQLNRRF